MAGSVFMLDCRRHGGVEGQGRSNLSQPGGFDTVGHCRGGRFHHINKFVDSKIRIRALQKLECSIIGLL